MGWCLQIAPWTTDRRWLVQAEGLETAGDQALKLGQVRDAWDAYSRAGEAYRFGCFCEHADRLHSLAESLTERGSVPWSINSLRWAAVDGLRGNPLKSLERLKDVKEQTLTVNTLAVLTDSRIGYLLMAGMREEAERLLQVLKSSQSASSRLSLRFRSAELLILDGRFNQCMSLIDSLEHELGALDPEGTGAYALQMMRADIFMTLKDWSAAHEVLSGVAAYYRRTYRVDAWLRCSAYLARVSVRMGQEVQEEPLAKGQIYALEKGLLPLACSLDLAMGVIAAEIDRDGATENFRRAWRLADTLGLSSLARLARWLWVDRCGWSEEGHKELLHGRTLSGLSEPMHARMEWLIVCHSTDLKGAGWYKDAIHLYGRFTDMEMSADAQAVREFLVAAGYPDPKDEKG